MDDIYCSGFKSGQIRDSNGDLVILVKRYSSPEGAAPRVESPVLNFESAILEDINRAIVAHPATVIRNSMPVDI